MNKIIEPILSSHAWISDIVHEEELHTYEGKSFECVFIFNAHILNEDIPLLLGVPSDWDLSLFCFYLLNYKTIKLIPHMEDGGKLCLYDLEGLLIDPNFEGLLNQMLDRLKCILEEGISESNRSDFVKEFDAYWMRLLDIKQCRSYIAGRDSIEIIKFAKKGDFQSKKKNEDYAQYKNRVNNAVFIIANDEHFIARQDETLTIMNGVYINIKTDSEILPPDWRENLSVSYVNILLDSIHDKVLLRRTILKTGRELLLVFKIDQTIANDIMIAIYIRNPRMNYAEGKIELVECTELWPCLIRRCDKKFLKNRSSTNITAADKRVLVIGCGSIGGYLIDQLVKYGINNITIVDFDKFREENIYRHLLGLQFVDKYKTVAIKEYIESNIPGIIINTREDRIDNQLKDGGIDLSDFDVIFSTTGDHNINRWLNKYILSNQINVPAIYLWNEALGIGSHAAIINNLYDGCYDCFIGYADGLYDRTSYCARDQYFGKMITGCNSTYIPYSAAVSIKTTLLGLEILDQYFSDKIVSNFILSLKGDDSYFKAEGFETSDRYQEQKTLVDRIDGRVFVKENCICASQEAID